MSVSEFKEVISKIKDYTNTICLHVKGEPLLHSKLNEILNICDDNNIKASLTTNGTLLKNKINELIKHKSLSKVHISLNAEVTNQNYLNDIFKAVSNFPQEKIIIYRIWALKEDKLDEKSTKIVEKLKEYYNLSNDTVEKLQKKKNTKIDFNKYVDKDYHFIWPIISNNKSNGFCEGLKSQLAILSDGTVTVCCLDDDGLINLGNIFLENLKDILEKSKTKRIIEGFRNNKCVEKLCQSCSYKNRFK